MSSKTKQGPDQQQLSPATAPQSAEAPAVEAQDTLGNAAVQDMLAPGERGESLGTTLEVGGNSTSTNQLGDGAVDNGAGKWVGRTDVRAHPEGTPDGAKLVVDRFHTDFTYWARANAPWSTMDQFPGGAYDENFNTRDGALVHEEAEVLEAEFAFEDWEMRMMDIVNAGPYSDGRIAVGLWNREQEAGETEYKAVTDALRTHANTAGPDAEWSFYQQNVRMAEEEEEA